MKKLLRNDTLHLSFSLLNVNKIMEEQAFFTPQEHKQLVPLYRRLLRLSGDTLQKDDCRNGNLNAERRDSRRNNTAHEF